MLFRSGDLKQRLDTDVEVVQSFFTTHCIDYIYATISALVLTGFMFYINWILTLIGLVAVPLSFLFASFMSKKPGRIADAFRTQHGMYETDVHNAFQNWRMIKAHGLEQHESNMVKKHWDILTPLFIKKQIYWFINRSFIAIKDTFITTMNLYFVGGILVINGQLELGLLLMFMNYYSKFPCVLVKHFRVTGQSLLCRPAVPLGSDCRKLRLAAEEFGELADHCQDGTHMGEVEQEVVGRPP